MDENSTHDGALKFSAKVGGACFNVAVGLSRLGEKTALLTGISNDFFGQNLFKHLQSEGVETSYLVHNTKRTTLSIVGISDEGIPHYSFYNQDAAECAMTKQQMPDIDSSVQGLHFGSYSCVKDPCASLFLELAQAQKAKGCFISYDVNLRLNIENDINIWQKRFCDFAKLSDFVKFSKEDIEKLFPKKNCNDLAGELITHGVGLVVMTAGGEDGFAWTKNHHIRFSPYHLETIEDTVGAGDSFQACLLSQLSKKNLLNSKNLSNISKTDLTNSLMIANKAAHLTCTKTGADLPYSHELIVLKFNHL